MKKTNSRKFNTVITQKANAQHKKKTNTKHNVPRNISCKNTGNISNRTKKNKQNILLLKSDKVELLLLFSTFVNYFILLKECNASRMIYKKKIIEVLLKLRSNNKLIHKNTSNADINKSYILIYKYFTKIIQTLYDKKEHKGGFYFKDIEDKGDQPITGSDITKLLDETQDFFANAKYTNEGEFLNNTDTLLSMLRGDIGPFKSFLQYRVFSKYYTVRPPFIKWDAIKDIFTSKQWEDIPDYLLAYQSYLRSRDEYLVAKGLKSPNVLQKDLYTGFYNKLAHSLDENILKMQRARSRLQGKEAPLTLPQ